jgi:hypothetical protein
MTDNKLPIVGDIVYWHGEYGPHCVLIEEDYLDGIYKVRWISGEPLPWTEWKLDNINQASWNILCHLPV